GHLLQDLRQRPVRGEQLIDVVADTASRRYSDRHGRGSFLRRLAGLEGNLRPSLIYTGSWTPPGLAAPRAGVAIAAAARGDRDRAPDRARHRRVPRGAVLAGGRVQRLEALRGAKTLGCVAHQAESIRRTSSESRQRVLDGPRRVVLDGSSTCPP